jgi:hypothetical protein
MKTRRVLAIVSVCFLVVFVWLWFLTWTPVTVVKNKPLTDLLKAAIELKVDQSRSEFQLALLALGALWALMIAKKDEAQIVLSDAPEVIMFCASSALLVISAIFHFTYVEGIAYVFSLAGGIDGGKSIPDVFGSGFNNPYQLQLWSLVGGLVVALMTLVSAHRLKGKQ